MKNRPIITKIEVHELEFELKDVERKPTIAIPIYKPGSVTHGGVTGTMKIARAAATRNTNYYEMGLVHPKMPHSRVSIYKCGYRDGPDAIDSNGCVQVPEGPGLGVEYDWDHTNRHSTGVIVYE